MDPPDQHPTLAQSSRKLIFLRVVIAGTILFAIIFLSFINDAQRSITGKPTWDMLIIVGLINLGLYVLIRSSGLNCARFQIPVLTILVLAQIGLVAALKLDGVYGNGRPKLVWRWQKNPADEFVNHKSANQSPDLPDVIALKSNQGDWTEFRGPNRSGIAAVFLRENSKPKLAWKRQIGGGWSSFAASGDVCVTQEQRGEVESTVCYLVKNGQQVWSFDQQVRFKDATSGDGPRATPTIDGKFVYAFGATGILNCLNLTNGELVWTVDVLKDVETENRNFGMAGSPLVVDGKVIVAPGGSNSSLVAYDKFSGVRIWSNGNYTGSYSSPQFLMLGDTKTVLIFNGDGLTSHRLDTGEEIFHFPWVSNPDEQNNVCQPICFARENGNSQIFISSGYGKGSALLEFDVRTQTLNLAWKSKRLKSKFASAVRLGNYVYGLDEGILTCISLATGDRIWKDGRYGHGQLIRLGETLVIQAERGYLAFVDATPAGFREKYTVDALDSRTWNHPALAGEFLLVRNDRQACCFKLSIE